jgi:hypothetical protein
LKALVGLVLFVVLPIALVLWVYYITKKYPARSLPADGKTDTHSLMKSYYKEHGKKVLPLLIAIAGLWVATLMLRIYEFW